MAVVAPRGYELGEGELLEAAGVPVREGFGVDDFVDDARGQDEPPQPHAGREALAGSPGIDDMIGGRAPASRPPAGGRSETPRRSRPRSPAGRAPRPIRRRGSAGSGRGRRRAETGAPASAAQRRRRRARRRWRRTHRSPRREFAARSRSRSGGSPGGRTPRWPGWSPPVPEHVAEQVESLGEARADHDSLRARANAAGPREQAGDGPAQLRPAAGIVALAECLGRRRGQSPPRRRQPAGAGKGGRVGGPRAQVITRPGALDSRGHRRLDGERRVGDAGARAAPRDQPALGDQLGVGASDGVAGHSEVLGQGARGRQRRSRRQPPARHGLPQRRFQPRSDGLSVELELEIDAGNGPRFCQRPGPYMCAALRIGSKDAAGRGRPRLSACAHKNGPRSFNECGPFMCAACL